MRLQIIVHTEHIIALRIVQGCHKCIVLSEVAHQIDAAHIRILCAKLLDLLKRVIRRTVIDEHKFTFITIIFFKLCHHELDDLADRLLRIIAGDYD